MNPASGCTLRITNIPRDCKLDILKQELGKLGTIHFWLTPPGPVHVYVTLSNEKEAHAVYEHINRDESMVADFACIYQ